MAYSPSRWIFAAVISPPGTGYGQARDRRKNFPFTKPIFSCRINGNTRERGRTLSATISCICRRRRASPSPALRPCGSSGAETATRRSFTSRSSKIGAGRTTASSARSWDGPGNGSGGRSPLRAEAHQQKDHVRRQSQLVVQPQQDGNVRRRQLLPQLLLHRAGEPGKLRALQRPGTTSSSGPMTRPCSNARN